MTKKVVINSKRVGNKNINSQKNTQNVQDERKINIENERVMTNKQIVGIQGQGQTYGSKKIILDPPPKDVIVKIADIDRDIIVDDVKMVNEGANVSALIIESITYYTSKPFPPQKDEQDDEENDHEKDKKGVIVEDYTRDCIAMDGVVRSAITVIPCLVYVNLPGCSQDDEFEIVDASIQAVNTRYILRDEDQCEETNLLFNYYEGVIEEYVVTINMVKQ